MPHPLIARIPDPDAWVNSGEERQRVESGDDYRGRIEIRSEPGERGDALRRNSPIRAIPFFKRPQADSRRRSIDLVESDDTIRAKIRESVWNRLRCRRHSDMHAELRQCADHLRRVDVVAADTWPSEGRFVEEDSHRSARSRDGGSQKWRRQRACLARVRVVNLGIVT